MSVRSIVGIAALLAAAAGSYYLSQSLQQDEATPTTSASLQRGFYLRSARILGTGADGQLVYEVEADYAEQLDDDLIEMQSVSVVYSTQSGVPWNLSADTARISRNQERLTLAGNVVATTAEGPEGQATEIRTPHLELEPKLYRAETEDRVQIRIGTRSLSATGMLASLNDNRLTLKSNVSGKFVP